MAKMRSMVVQCHPLRESYNQAVFDAALDALTEPEHPVPTVRLCEESSEVEPALDAEALREMLRDVEHLVFVYPTWWGALPARLLQALTDLIGDVVDGHSILATSPLRSVRRLSIVTTHGSSRLVNRLQGEPGLMLFKHTVLDLCAPGCAFDWISLYGIDRLDDEGRQAFLERVRAELAEVNATA